MDCEKCKIIYPLDWNGKLIPDGRIDFCPLHAATGKLLKAAKEALDVLDSLEYYDEARDMLRKAIAKAEGSTL